MSDPAVRSERDRSRRPDLSNTKPARAGLVRQGRRPPRQRLVLDRTEHAGTIPLVGENTIRAASVTPAACPSYRWQNSGWSAKQIHQTVISTFQLSDRRYGTNQLRYDLRKLKGHGLLQRDGSHYDSHNCWRRLPSAGSRLTPSLGPGSGRARADLGAHLGQQAPAIHTAGHTGHVPRRFDRVKPDTERRVGADRVNRSDGCAGPLGPPGVLTCAVALWSRSAGPSRRGRLAVGWCRD